MNSAQQHDVVIVGAGPAGSTAATLLARDGHDVLVLEREEFPRFKIGESLLPSGREVLNRLGVQADDEAFVYKRGARFVRTTNGEEVVFAFVDNGDGQPQGAWHVDRALFDTRLRDMARDAGATVQHGARVTRLNIDDDGVTVGTDQGEHRCRYVIDASGQARVSGRLFRSIEPNTEFGSSACFVHASGLSDETLAEIGPGHDIRILVDPAGWGWAIPLPGRRLSIGFVSRENSLQPDEVLGLIQRCERVRRWTEGTEISEPTQVSNFSYRNTRPVGPRFCTVGDASYFIDPVFSSGVSLALAGAAYAADLLGPALREGAEADDTLMQPLVEHMQRGFDVFGALVHRFYATRLIDNVFFAAPPEGELRDGIIRVMAGEVWSDDNRFIDMLMRSRIRPGRSTSRTARAARSGAQPNT